MKPIRVLIVVNQPIIREGLATILSNQEDMKVVGKAQNGLEAVQLVDDCQPDVVLLDMQMPVISGLDSLVAIKESHPHTPIIMLTTFLDPVYICEALRKGASGYILKDVELEQLVMSIRQCVKGQIVFPASIQSVFMTQRDLVVTSTQAKADSVCLKDELLKRGMHLNEREYSLLVLLAKGNSNQQIANELFLSIGTVKNYISKLYRKMNVSNRHEIMAVVHQLLKERL